LVSVVKLKLIKKERGGESNFRILQWTKFYCVRKRWRWIWREKI